jgi:hypothetical protein
MYLRWSATHPGGTFDPGQLDYKEQGPIVFYLEVSLLHGNGNRRPFQIGGNDGRGARIWTGDLCVPNAAL